MSVDAKEMREASSYWVRVKNAVGVKKSNTAIVTVNPLLIAPQ
jgi:hypothetical protein